jgi:hypothetical protein
MLPVLSHTVIQEIPVRNVHSFIMLFVFPIWYIFDWLKWPVLVPRISDGNIYFAFTVSNMAIEP